jgi:hypothetical protein
MSNIIEFMRTTIDPRVIITVIILVGLFCTIYYKTD